MSELLKIGRNDLATIRHQDLMNRQTDKDIIRQMVKEEEERQREENTRRA